MKYNDYLKHTILFIGLILIGSISINIYSTNIQKEHNIILPTNNKNSNIIEEKETTNNSKTKSNIKREEYITIEVDKNIYENIISN